MKDIKTSGKYRAASKTLNKILSAERIEGLVKSRRELAILYSKTTDQNEKKALAEPYKELERAIWRCIEEEAKYLTGI